MINSEKKAEILKAIKFGNSDEVICDLEGITPAELAEIKKEAQANA